jgi:hypothetical protein
VTKNKPYEPEKERLYQASLQLPDYNPVVAYLRIESFTEDKVTVTIVRIEYRIPSDTPGLDLNIGDQVILDSGVLSPEMMVADFGPWKQE